jgi:hypothetical protein
MDIGGWTQSSSFRSHLTSGKEECRAPELPASGPLTGMPTSPATESQLTESAPAAADAAELCSQLIRFDTSNFGGGQPRGVVAKLVRILHELAAHEWPVVIAPAGHLLSDPRVIREISA